MSQEYFPRVYCLSGNIIAQERMSHKDQSRPSHCSTESSVRTNRRDSSNSSALNDFKKPLNYQRDPALAGTELALVDSFRQRSTQVEK
jgi:hypothetical protein